MFRLDGQLPILTGPSTGRELTIIGRHAGSWLRAQLKAGEAGRSLSDHRRDPVDVLWRASRAGRRAWLHAQGFLLRAGPVGPRATATEGFGFKPRQQEAS